MKVNTAQYAPQPGPHRGIPVASAERAARTSPTPIAELIANCEHGKELDRGGFLIGGSTRPIRWRILFCDPCWEHFRYHQEVIDLRYFESSPAGPAPEESR